MKLPALFFRALLFFSPALIPAVSTADSSSEAGMRIAQEGLSQEAPPPGASLLEAGSQRGQPIETARLQITPGLSMFFGKEKTARFSLLLSFQAPVLTASGNIIWRLQAGGGWNQPYRRLWSEDSSEGFCSSFFQENRRERIAKKGGLFSFAADDRKEYEECEKRNKERDRQSRAYDRQKYAYFEAVTGLMFAPRPYFFSGSAGAVYGGPKGLGWKGRLTAGWMISDSLALEAGGEWLHHGRPRLGFSLALSFFVKNWMETADI